MRPIFAILAALASVWGIAFFAIAHTAEPTAQEADRWLGRYLKYARYDSHRQGQFGEAQQITITKKDDGYYLSKPYDLRKFTEVEKGVLSDAPGGLGKIYLGSAEFADGKRFRVLRVEFCYEHFILYSESEQAARQSDVKKK
jgi:hypothetical protein